MKVIKFNLNGKTAFFKKPDVNKIYFTYSNIHKVALCGIFGSIVGYGGYNQQQKEDDYPEFYEKLKDMKISIVPKVNNISKKLQTFNNSIGYASKEEGGNLIIKEQWLENPSWDIYILFEEKYQEIFDRLTKSKFKYIPYLGKNDHVANVNDVEILEAEKLENFDKIDSLFINDNLEITTDNFEFDFYEDCEEKFKYQEKLPYELELTTNQYILRNFVFTNMNVSVKDQNCLEDDIVYKINEKNIYFF